MATKQKSMFDDDNIIRMSDVEYKELRWLWYPYIPMGMTTMLFGRGGIGKSHIVVDIAARITTGTPFPGEDKGRPPGNVLILSAEDDYGAVLKGRLERAGADLTRIMAPKSESFVLDPRGIRDMADLMARFEVAFVYIDPVAQFLGGKVDMNRMNEVRQWTGELNQAAKQSGAAIVIVHHIKKGRDTADWEAAAGSVDFVNSMRSTLLVERTNDGTRVMRNPKNNNAKEGLSLSFTLDDDGFEWGEAFEDGGRMYGGPKTRDTQAFIRTYLANGPVPAATFIAAALDAGYNKGMLDRAKVGVAESYAKRIGDRTIWFWRLKGDKREQSYIQIMGNTDGDNIPPSGRDLAPGVEGRGPDVETGNSDPVPPTDVARPRRASRDGFTKDGDPRDKPQPGWFATLDPETVENLRKRGVHVPE